MVREGGEGRYEGGERSVGGDIGVYTSVSGVFVFFFFKQKTAYEIYQCDWSSDVCSSDLTRRSIGSMCSMPARWGW